MKQEIKKWVETQSGQFFSTSLLTIQDKLEPGVYELNNVLGTDLALTRISEGFPVYGKIYDLQADFINRCVRSFQNSSRCMGVILHGPKGTGKTITAEQIAKAKQQQEAKVKALVQDQANRLKQLENANLEALSQNQELQLKNDNLTVQIQVLQSERSAQMFLYGAMTIAVGVILGFFIASYVYTKRRRQW